MPFSSRPLLDRAALSLLAILPLAMALANRSAAAILAVAGVLALLARITSGGRLTLPPPAPAAAALTFIAWAAVSLAWSHAPATSLFVAAEAGLPFLGGVLLLISLPRDIPAAFVRWAAIAFAAACVLIVAELAAGLAPREALGLRAQSFIFNRPVMTLLLIFWPLAIQMKRLGWGRWALALGALLIVTVERATSGAAMLGLLLALPAFLVASWSRRTGLLLAGAMLAGCLVIAPFKGVLLERILPPSLIARLESVHAADRIEIWQDFAAIVQRRPLTGAGFGVSAKMAEAPAAAEIPPERGRLLAAGHPHDGFLQIWAELGLVGALLAALNGFFILRAIARLPHDMIAAAAASTIAAAAVVSVFHGAWQGWWIGLLMATAFWCSRETRRES
ncbi:O-antigen ligase [Pseudochelatococcus lubricantis]|uniref:O-antigen ligase n=1 Tax=Pseudochelatococcus lubricantis TaxID=1538102 RepID=A0ABX0UUW5_9HYPH|nr:O-antigen ligase family protein [Pseudochelatococcus lubricantis]NIJ56752.1 O-antigen ligase [Pseudochelatococcus lubricantis]